MRYPSEAEALYLLRKYRLFKEIVEHSKNVAEIAMKIAEDIRANGHEVDLKLLKSAALLHDIGKWKYNRQRGGTEIHEYESGRLLRELGWPEFADICESHVGVNKAEAEKLGFPEPHDTMPKTLEAKIIYIADKIRPGSENLQEIIETFKRSKKLKERYWSRCPGFMESSIRNVTKIWHELEKMGMRI